MKSNNIFIPIWVITLMAAFTGAAILITPFRLLALEGGAVIIIILLYLGHRDIANLLVVWLVTLLFVMFTKAPLGDGMPNISPDRGLWCLLLFYYSLNFVKGKIPLGKRHIETFMGLLVFIAIISILRMKSTSPSSEILDTYSLLFNTYVVPFSIFILAKDFICEEEQVRKIFWFFSIALFYISITAIFEHFGLKRFIFPRGIANPSLGIHFGRARGPFLQAAINGTVLGILSVSNMHMAIHERFPKKIFFILTGLISPLAILFTYTRAAWLAALLSFVFVVVMNGRFRRLLLLMIFAGSLFLVPFHSRLIDSRRIAARSYSVSPIYDRLNLYRTYFAMASDRPVLGFGFANYNNYSYEYFSRVMRDNPYDIDIPGIHDTFMGVLVELGIAGLAVFLVIIAMIFRTSSALFRRSGKEGFLGKEFVVAFWGMAIVYLVNSLFIDMKQFQFQNAIIYLTAGVMTGVYKKRLNDA